MAQAASNEAGGLIRVGIGGWTYEPWRGVFYPPGLPAKKELEYASGRLLRAFVGRAPWDYGRTRFAVDGLARLDYLPLWAAYALGLERLHDLLVGTADASRG